MNASEAPGEDSITSSELENVRQLVMDWVRNRRDAEWMDRHLTEDFRFSTFLLPRIVEKREFLDIVSNTAAKLDVVSVAADPVGKIVLSRLVLDVVEEDFTADMGAGMPTGEQIRGRIVGRRLLYASSFRRGVSGWQCYDHHQVGPVD